MLNALKNFLKKQKEILKERLSTFSVMTMLIGVAGIIVYMILIESGSGSVSAGVVAIIIYIAALVLAFVTTNVFSTKTARRQDDIIPALSNVTLDLLIHLYLPVLICDFDGKIIWQNRAFSEITKGQDYYGKSINQLIAPSLEALMSDANPKGIECKAFDRCFFVKGYNITSPTKKYCITVWRDETELVSTKEKLLDKEVLVAFIVIDNMDEIMQFTQSSYRAVASEIEKILNDFAEEYGGVLKEYERDKYMLLFEAKHLDSIIERKFDILDKIRKIQAADAGIPATVSIGVAKMPGGTLSIEERAAASAAALDMALQRGGDQAVVKTDNGMEFFGGVTKTVQKRTKVRARVVANELVSLMEKSSNILIMGHRNADFDSFGAAIGVARLALSNNIKANIVINLKDPNLRKPIEKLKTLEEYDNMFIDAVTAQEKLKSDTLLIIVDVNNEKEFESPDLAKVAHSIVYIDHHRKTKEFDTPPALNYIEPSASSTCELIAELLEQILPSGELNREEAELIFAGIQLDTKRFSQNTSVRTFSAAQYLRGAGANPVAVQELFTTSLDSIIAEAKFETNVVIYRKVLAIAVNNSEDSTEDDRIAAAKVADKLLTVDGVQASFALCKIGNTVRISARSDGTINVQLILEKLSGGGHFNSAATQLKDSTLADALARLKHAIDEYFDEKTA